MGRLVNQDVISRNEQDLSDPNPKAMVHEARMKDNKSENE
jgi:hypothetical protein